MADDRKITIEIISSEGKQEEDKPKDPNEEQHKANKQLSEMLHFIEHPLQGTKKAMLDSIDKDKHPLSYQVSTYLLNEATDMLTRVGDYYIDRHLNLTEDYLAQNNYRKIKAQYSLAKNAFQSVAGGAASGAMVGGVPGAVLGAIGGALSFGVNTALEQRQRYSQYYQQLNATNFNMQYNQKRAGLYDGSRGTEG